MASGSPPPHPSLPNPETPLAFLPPTLASQFEVSRYLLVATCGVCTFTRFGRGRVLTMGSRCSRGMS
jgi:hypothetical protein